MNPKPMTKNTVETLYEHLQQARQRLILLRCHLDHDETFHLVAAGSGAAFLSLDPEVVHQLLENEIEKASWVIHDLEKKVEIINRTLNVLDADLDSD